jgi:topoisomerase IV subunit A
MENQTFLEPLMRQNFIEYASYVVVDRAIPDVRDGCKPVQRRLLHTLFEIDDGKFHKVANVIGESMKLHPHGDVSIGDALVVLANKEYFIEKQGNYGNILTGHAAAAARYIECRLTPLARETLFNPALTQFRPSYDGRKLEPEALPAKIPVVLMLGTEGIAVGMATKIFPHNFAELLQAQIKILQEQRFKLYPDFLHGGLMDVSEYADGKGRIRVRARIDAPNEKTVVIRDIPFGTTTESLIASIESAVQKGKVKISSINDYTTDKVEIELVLSRGIYADEVVPQLYAYTDCEISLSSNIVVIRDRHPAELTVSQVLHDLTDRLVELIKAELEYNLAQLIDKQHWMTLEQLFIEHRVYKRIESAETADKVQSEVYKGMQPYAEQFIRDMTDDDVERLLEIRIRRISAFDINKHRQNIDEILKAIKGTRSQLKNLTKTVIQYLEDLLAKYGGKYPRRTQITTFDVVDKKAVARQNLKVSYDRDSGFFGTEVKGDEYQYNVSEYDLILIICDDGSFRIGPPPEKILLSGKVLFCQLFDPEKGEIFTVVYRDNQKNVFAKKVHIHKFIRNKEYELIKDKQGKVDLLLQSEKPGMVDLTFVKKPRQQVDTGKFNLSELEMMGTTTRGIRIAPKPVAKITLRNA